MSLFQNAVAQKYLNRLDASLLDTKFSEFTSYFGNPAIQENIRNSKEEQFQEGFLRELFVKILGYTLNPSADFNLTTEYKNVKDSKKADGAIVIDHVVKGVIELKGTEIADLSRIEAQGFGYKNNQPDCDYVITSNFEKLRFYIGNAIEFEEFNLFTLTRAEFALLYLCLSYHAIANRIPKAIKSESLGQEDVITRKLYQDYSLFKRELYRNLIDQNPQHNSLILFTESQKLLDRFLFLFFAEDRQLLPPNSVRLVLDDWRDLQERDEHVPLYNRFKKYFGYMNTGFKGKRYDVYAYNGGLFRPDEILDSLAIDDELLYKHTRTLSEYDFASEVDVNILGHIFENSLNEIDEIKASIEGHGVDKTKTRRKKDGIFYTPKYITRYIVENTVGKLCNEKKAELAINEEDYASDRKRNIKTREPLAEKLKTYRSWLLQLTICDPACGSGAFLNQALDFLITEHRHIDELQARLFGDSLVLSDIEKSILENNLFGVDLNEESVEIAKLSLWLRTAQPNRKLNDLNNNIKCGNSLIDDPAVAGEKAFNWQKEFPEIFAKGGFDVLIGNPPYGALLHQIEKDFFKVKYITTEYNYDTYNFFFELSINLLKTNGFLGFITPNTFIVVENGKLLRKLLFLENQLLELFETFNVFPDAVVEPIISILRKKTYEIDSNIDVYLDSRDKSKVEKRVLKYSQIFDRESLIFNYRETDMQRHLYEKIRKQSIELSNLAFVTTGIKPYQVGKGVPKQTKEIVADKPFNSYTPGEGWQPLIRGTQINRYSLEWDGEFVQYGIWLAEPRTPEIFINQKLFIRRTDDKLLCVYDHEGFIGVNSVHCIQSVDGLLSNKYLLTLINSRLLNWYFQHENFHMVGKPLAEVKVVFVERLPIIKVDSKSQISFVDHADLMHCLNHDLVEVAQKFQRTIQRKFSLADLSTKIRDWYLLSYAEFIAELGKKKVKLSLTEEAEWEAYFIQEVKKALELKARIEATDREIDQMVYQLYGLTEEEIKIVEGN